jgi:Rrf2 family protein
MQIGTRLRYGMMALLDLARRGQSEPVRAVDIANAAGISKGYLEGLLAALRRAGLVRAVRGPGGGWQLTRPPSKIRPTQVYAILEGPVALVRCIEWPESCDQARGCASRRLWTSMSKALEKSLKEETIAQLAGLVKKRPASKREARGGKRAKPKARAKPKRKSTPKKARAKARARVKGAKMRVVKKKPAARKKVVRAVRRLKRSA